MHDDIFTKIIAGEIPSARVYEDEETFAFLDIAPKTPGHTLVVPKQQYANIYDIPEDTLCHVMRTVKMLAPAIKRAVQADGINIGMNNEPAAGQEVMHAHVHIIPRFAEDGLEFWPSGTYKEGEAEKIAEKIQSEMET